MHECKFGLGVGFSNRKGNDSVRTRNRAKDHFEALDLREYHTAIETSASVRGQG